MKPHESWKVLPHGEIMQVADNLYTVVGKLRMPLGETQRRMTIVQLAGGRLAIYSAIALAEPQMRRLDELGKPAFLIVPTGIHRIDAKPWKDRYPDATVIAPAGAHHKIEEVVSVDDTRADLGDSRVHVDEVPGTDRRELFMLVESTSGKTLVVSDLIFNLPPVHGIAGLGLRMLGFHPGHPAMPKLVKRKLVADPDAVRRQLQAWADLGLARILPAHGAPIDNPRETLRELAAAA